MNQHSCTSEAGSCICWIKIITLEAQSGRQKNSKSKGKEKRKKRRSWISREPLFSHIEKTCHSSTINYHDIPFLPSLVILVMVIAVK
jgi:hypothetical protein